MSKKKSSAPLAIIIFNRPLETERLISALRALAPKKIFVIADGPRPDRKGEAEKCKTTRDVLKLIDWPCDIETNFSDTNLGCKERVVSGLDWVFTKTDRAIVLEDDCIPSPSFIPYCEELLEFYKDSTDVGVISGSTLDSMQFESSASYFFSNYPRVWGWATWSRTWKLYDKNIEQWPSMRGSRFLSEYVHTRSGLRHWKAAFNGVHRNIIDTWDYQLVFCLWKNGLKAIAPDKNMISNIGFGPDATHTLNPLSAASEMPTFTIELPLTHPMNKSVTKERDIFMEHAVFQRGLESYFLNYMSNISRFLGITYFARKLYSQLLRSRSNKTSIMSK